MYLKKCLLLSLMLGIAACSNSRYHIKHDSAPLRKPTASEMQDAKVVTVKKSVSASRPYTVRGKRYVPMHDEKGYSEQGIASWYGRKFHGYHTSNGEIFNMFAMTAAHKTLPLPSFVRVTNLENGKQAVVRVNDRGPFHDERLIDLSYAAAYKLGVTHHGTAKVKIEALSHQQGDKHQAYIQIAASQNPTKLGLLARQLEVDYGVPSIIKEKNGIFRLRLGPIKDANQAQQLLKDIKLNSHEKAFMLYSDS